MTSIRLKYAGRSGRYSKEDTEKMARLQDEYNRTRRFLNKGERDPEAVNGDKTSASAAAISLNANHHAPIPPIARGKAPGGGASNSSGASNNMEEDAGAGIGPARSA